VSDLVEASPRLSDLSEQERSVRFGRLQQRLVPLWTAMRLNQPGESIVVVPSVAPDSTQSGTVLQALEERMLFLLFLLRKPRLRVIYVTGRPVPESVVEYYLGLLPGVIPRQARARLHMVATHDGSTRSLAEKLLARPRVLAQVRALIPDPARCHLVPYTTSALERDLALTLGIPLYGADPDLLPFGTKTGCRRLFADAGVPHPLGYEDVHDSDGVVDALAAMRAAKPAVTDAIVKLNEGVAGRGNAVIDLRDLPAPGVGEERPELGRRVEAMAFEHADTLLTSYLAQLAQDGGIVEERVNGVELRSPSVQLRVTPLGEVELLSTHDQLLGGPSGQTYLGCRFPADFGYAQAITREAAKVGERLAKEGVLGRFAVDFVVVRGREGAWTPYAIELNLRKGGTTHPFLTLQFLTDGEYNPTTALFTAPSGREKHLVATDHLENELLRGLTIDDLFDIAVRNRLHFDQARQTGVVFHMMGALAELGSVGLTAVADSREQADVTFRRAERVLGEEAGPPPEPALPPL
jgi:PGM1 C-terminal domain